LAQASFAQIAFVRIPDIPFGRTPEHTCIARNDY